MITNTNDIPKGCLSWSNGCNTCSWIGGSRGKEYGCTKIYSGEREEEITCLTYTSSEYLPSNCIEASDGCNILRKNESGNRGGTKIGCIEKAYKCLRYVDKNGIPEGCIKRSDGCNTCEKGGWCTLKYCGEKERKITCLEYEEE